MDLVTVKAAVKSWEKTFRASHGRAPTKEDIKADPSDIASQYALYRKLSKSDSSSSQSSQSRPTSSSTSASTSLSAGPSITSISARSSQNSRSTPRIIPANEYPTTPTPPSRKSTLTPSVPIEPLSLSQDAAKSLKRTASKAQLNGRPSSPPSASRSALSAFLTPKKSAYSGPIHDPNSINPFSATPTKPSPIAGPSSSSKIVVANGPGTSPFIHASSPRKLREVLQANSLRKVKERESPKEITPRTRARKRLRGEAVDDTPVKDRLPRRKRGEGSTVNGYAGAGSHSTANFVEDAEMDEEAETEEEEEDEFGPSPMKPSAFTALLKEQDDPGPSGSKGEGRGKGKSKLNPAQSDGAGRAKLGEGQKDIRSMFAKSSKSAISPQPAVKEEESPMEDLSTVPPLEESGSDKRVSSTPSLPTIDTEAEERASTPPPAQDQEDVLPSSPPKSIRAQRILTIDDDEQDEWDPEGGNAQRQLVIVPTRRAVRPRDSSDEWDSPDEPPDTTDETRDVDVDIDTPNSSSTRPFAPSLLSTLSLHSPHRRSAKSQLREDDLRVKAIFDPLQATRLKALKKGQDVYEAGEAPDAPAAEYEDGVLERYEGGLPETLANGGDVFGDDDWESENEGWKRSVGGLSDDEW